MVTRLGEPFGGWSKFIHFGRNRGREYFIASDPSAFIAHTREVLYLDDGEVAVLTPEGINIFENGLAKNKKSQTLEWSHETVEKQGHPHFMLKEISEQPKVINDTIRGRLKQRTGWRIWAD